MPFKFDPPRHPEFGTEPRGTVETVSGCALFSEENGTYDWDGETDVWWDEQRTVEDKDGRVQLIDRQGHTWWAKMIEVK